MEKEYQVIEDKELIAMKIPSTPDSWKFLDGSVVESLTEAYETYFQKTGVKKFQFDASVMPAEIYSVSTKKVEVEKEEPTTYSMYGEMYGSYSQENENK